MNAESTPTRAKLPSKGGTLSVSLKERLKRCGRYHVGSPATVAPLQQTSGSPEHASESSLTRSLEMKVSCQKSFVFPSQLTQNPTKKKVDLCVDDESSEFVAADNISCTSEMVLPGKRKAAEEFSESNPDGSKISFEKYDITLREHNDSLRNSSQQKNSDDLLKSETGANSSAGNCAKAAKYSDDATDCMIGSSKEQPASKSRFDSVNKESLSSQLQYLDSELKEKLELLRKLKMVKMYREKNDLTELQQLIDRWRGVSQAALTDLLGLHPEPRPSMRDLISHLQIDPELVQYDAEEQDFL